MTEENFEKLARAWPHLIKKANVEFMGVGDGWFDIINVLCGLISNKLENRIQSLAYLNGEKSIDHCEIERLTIEIAQLSENLPTIVQVKEKFGRLGFYVSGASVEDHNYISFAESMSCFTCETCGSPAQRRTSGWVKTLCDVHYESSQRK